MPIKRAKSKGRKVKFAIDDDLFSQLKKAFKNMAPLSVSLEPKRERRLTKEQEKEINTVQYSIERCIHNIPNKKMPSKSNPKFWDILANKIPKNLIGRAIKYRKKWNENLKHAMDKRHKANLYKKN